MGYLCQFPPMCGFCGSMRRIICFLGIFWPIFRFFLQTLPQLKNFSKNLSVHIILILDDTFLPNLKFLDVLSLRYCLEKTQSPNQPTTHPAYFVIRVVTQWRSGLASQLSAREVVSLTLHFQLPSEEWQSEQLITVAVLGRLYSLWWCLGQLSIPPGLVNEDQLRLGRQRQV